MHWPKALLLLLITTPSWASEGWVLGGRVDTDSADGVAALVFGDIALNDKTNLYGSFGKSNVPLPRGLDLKTAYGDIGVDHWFGPRLRIGVIVTSSIRSTGEALSIGVANASS